MKTLLRDARESDVHAIGLIINHEIVHGTANYSYNELSAEDCEDWFQTKITNKRPILIAEIDGQIAGFGTYDQFRPKIGYRFTMEHTIYLHPDFRSKGIGTQLMSHLIERAKTDGMHAMIGGIDASNEGSIRFHERFGFQEVARFPEVGYKFDRWLDLVFMQLLLH